MSSRVPKSQRVQRPRRYKLSDFTPTEQAAIKAANSFYPGQIGVWGSRAIGNYAADSDLDLGVENYTKQTNVLEHLHKTFGFKFDIRPITFLAQRKEAIYL